MDNNIEQKLAALRSEYDKKLPEKIADIRNLYDSLCSKWDRESLVLFHRKVHSLHGSANIYGHEDIGKIAADLEAEINLLVEDTQVTQLPEAQKNKLLQLIEKL